VFDPATQRLATMPDHLDAAVDLGKTIRNTLRDIYGHPQIAISCGEVAVAAVEIAERGWLHDDAFKHEFDFHGFLRHFGLNFKGLTFSILCYDLHKYIILSTISV
jgi:hypothetical protein